ncbi:argininosuccinate lyase [Alteribacillus sp. YIM 98480]|uniref:argininosuccinate lyase n=1 Tax=Alteribacillus sp. YIM 98480 TaxID=2606599 RepID=UPI00131E3A5A|nr:argininosuccinate lyase [Alteribacillus sp. YIM 98480]
MRERLKTGPSKEMLEHIFKPAIQKDLKRSFYNMITASKAHLLMLMEEKIVNSSDGAQILQTLQYMEKSGPNVLTVDPALEELYFNMEKYIVDEIGVEVGGRLHTGRSRNDLYSTVTRMNTRERILDILKTLNELRQELLDKAYKNLDMVMTGYTHMQPAEPVTLAHYLSGILFSLERDFFRLVKAYRHLNLCPLGSAAFASTSFPINRERTAEMLGFDDIMNNSMDGVASRDYVLEILSSLNISLITLSRFSHDLYIWSTDEFSIIELDDSVAAVSSIMPQKKNPIILEHIKAKAAHVQGAYISASSALKNIPFTHTRESSVEVIKFFWDAVNETETALVLMKAAVESITVNKEKLSARFNTNFATVTELANVLVRTEGLSFRMAHTIVARFVAEKIRQGNYSSDANETLLKEVFYESVGRETKITTELIEMALDPAHNVAGKNTKGGPSPEEVKRQLEQLEEKVNQDQRTYWMKINQIEEGYILLNKTQALLGQREEI